MSQKIDLDILEEIEVYLANRNAHLTLTDIINMFKALGVNNSVENYTNYVSNLIEAELKLIEEEENEENKIRT